MARTGRRRRFGDLPLLWRTFLLNGIVFILGTAVLAISPATVSSPVALTEVVVLAIGLTVILGVNLWLLRAAFAPLHRLGHMMDGVDLLRPGARLPEDMSGPAGALVRTFNSMLTRLEAERGASTGRALAAQESERRRISTELHDEIGQSLTAVLLGLSRVADQAPPDLRAQLITVQETARTSLDDVRRIARRLRPGVLDDLGLLSALSELASEVERLGAIPIRRRIVHPLPGLSPDVELVLYRIAQESLTNVVRHARASTATLSLDLGHDDALGDVLRMVVTDDGVGVADSSEGAGLLGMRERALLVGGTLEIGSPATGGTAVALSIPVHAPDGAGAP